MLYDVVTTETKKDGQVQTKKSVIVNYFIPQKSLTMLVVVLAIIQVDFPVIFDRPLIKTEEYNISLMDTGVALITINSAMSNRKARPWFQVLTFKSQIMDILSSIFENLFLLFAGFLRFFLLSELDYQGHASEYGIHWNFYSTIAVINIMQSFLYDPSQSITLAIVIMTGYQLVLSATPLQDYVFYAPRTDIVSANREGLLSLIGYFSLLLFGIGIGRFIFFQMVEPELLDELMGNAKGKQSGPGEKKSESVKQAEKKQREVRFIVNMLILETLLITAYIVSKMAFGPPSRRLCNLPYALYQTALINSVSCLLLVWDRLLVVKSENMIENAINYNQLQFFVWANLLTGFFNLALKTFSQTCRAAFAVMFAYVFINVVVVTKCRQKGCCKSFF